MIGNKADVVEPGNCGGTASFQLAARLQGLQFLQEFPGAIRRSVVHDDDLIGEFRSLYAQQNLFDEDTLVENRNDD